MLQGDEVLGCVCVSGFGCRSDPGFGVKGLECYIGRGVGSCINHYRKTYGGFPELGVFFWGSP